MKKPYDENHYCDVPVNDDDIDGIYKYLAWHMNKEGMSSNCFHYLEVLKKKAEHKEHYTFENFPKDTTCVICGTNENTEMFLMGMDGTQNGDVIEARPTHLKCLLSHDYRYNNKMGIIYRFI